MPSSILTDGPDDEVRMAAGTFADANLSEGHQRVWMKRDASNKPMPPVEQRISGGGRLYLEWGDERCARG